MRSKPFIGILLSLLVAPALALADNDDNNDGVPDSTGTLTTDTDVETGEPLPEPQSTDDPAPPVASPGAPTGFIVKQAGVGSPTGYGRAGVLELGGSAGLTATGSFTAVNVSPELGWFVADNLELTGRLGVTHVKTDMDSGTITTAIVEPSYHLPFSRTAFGFLGMGVGAAYVSGPGMGLAIAPRIGGNFMIGRSGVLTPSLAWQYTTHDTAMVGENAQLLVVSSALMANIGYTVMW